MRKVNPESATENLAICARIGTFNASFLKTVADPSGAPGRVPPPPKGPKIQKIPANLRFGWWFCK